MAINFEKSILKKVTHSDSWHCCDAEGVFVRTEEMDVGKQAVVLRALRAAQESGSLRCESSGHDARLQG